MTPTPGKTPKTTSCNSIQKISHLIIDSTNFLSFAEFKEKLDINARRKLSDFVGSKICS